MTTQASTEKIDIARIKRYLIDLGFVCQSFPTAPNLIYVKDGETIIIKNFKKEANIESGKK